MESEVSVAAASPNEWVLVFNTKPNAYVFRKAANQWPISSTYALAQRDVNPMRRVWIQNRFSFKLDVIGVLSELAGGIGQNFYPAFVGVFGSWHQPLVSYLQNNPWRLWVFRQGFRWMFSRPCDDSGALTFCKNVSLPLYGPKRPEGETHTKATDDNQQCRQDVISQGEFVGSTPRFVFWCSLFCILSLTVGAFGGAIFFGGWVDRSVSRKWVGGLLAILGYLGFCSSLFTMIFDCLPWNWRRCLQESKYGNEHELHTEITVTRKLLTMPYYCNTLIAIGRANMANVLSIEKQVAIINALAEGSGIRQIECMTGVHRDTIMRLGVRVGQGCAGLLDRKMRNLSCQQLQFDVQEFRNRESAEAE
jgi:hypothetical protein